MRSPNFWFLETHDPLLVRLGTLAEKYCFEDPNTALIKMRQLAESLAKHTAAHVALYISGDDNFHGLIVRLRDRGVCPPDVARLFHSVRKVGNDAVHEHGGTAADALQALKFSRLLAIWFHGTFGSERGFKPGPFMVPPDPIAATATLKQELVELRDRMAQAEREREDAARSAEAEAEARREAESKAQAAYQELSVALELAEESESRQQEEAQRFETRLAALQQEADSTPSAVEAVVKQAEDAADHLDIDEADTRRLIDEQLRDAGWDADTPEICHAKGVRPVKGQNVAIAEWPTETGPVDYILFAGLVPIGMIEAKRASKDVPGVLGQTKRYAKGYRPEPDHLPILMKDSPYKVPFLFATNGRPYLRQVETKSGVWFLDGRRETNLSRALEGWYSPEGLTQLLEMDADEADTRLQEEPADYLGLREYQHQAIDAVEVAIRKGQREILLAMATGTGKTRTCIGLVYRLIKARRFRRVLFLVDRTSLGEQAGNAFKDVKLEQMKSFHEIYDVKELADARPDPKTRLHIATIQGMMKRLLFQAEGDQPIPVDRYDCIVVDECHRGYNLDREMTEAELGFRSDHDYFSKYRRVLDHFDAVKVGLTATPAIHTAEIFGDPVFEYGYRQAVIDGYLVDHEPPVRLITALGEDGILFDRGTEADTYDGASGRADKKYLPDDVLFGVEDFNRKVITESFNRTICTEVAREIDPEGAGKTLVFCANDAHADLVVMLLKKALADRHGEVADDAVMKITAAADRPSEAIRRFKNERLPSVVVTVDLLTTGIDVPAIDTVVFLRRVKSRILYEQMIGRATRLSPDLYGEGQDKEFFRILDAVDLYSALEPFSTMKPVSAKPKISFEQLVDELGTLDDEEARRGVLDQFRAKFQAKRRTLNRGDNPSRFEVAAGQPLDDFAAWLRRASTAEAKGFFGDHPTLVPFLDTATGGTSPIFISSHGDELRRREYGYPDGQEPGDYLESFRSWLESHQNEVAALKLVATRPRDLSRRDLKELRLLLDKEGFPESALRIAWRETRHEDVAATVIGFVRQALLGEDLIPYEERVDRAMQRIRARQHWAGPQRRWLDRIAKQLKQEVIVDRAALDQGQFAAHGGFKRINRAFDGQLETLLEDIQGEVWDETA